MNNTFSSNMLKIYEECPQKYKLMYEDEIKLPQDNSFAEEGKNIHTLINYYFKGFDTSKLTKTLEGKEKILWQNFLNLKIAQNNIFKSEYPFNVKINGNYWLTGRIDAIKNDSMNPSSKYTILDWKTGNIPKNPKNDLQTYVYLYSLYNILSHKKLIKNYEDLTFTYINLKDNSQYTTNLDEKKYLESERKIIKIISNIKTKAFKNNTDDTKCYKCSHQILCKQLYF